MFEETQIAQVTYSEAEAIKASTQYFGGDELAASVFIGKQALRDKEGNLLEQTPTDMHRRLAKEFARIEKNKFSEPMKEDEIFDLLDRYKYIVPQGSPMYGIGNPYSIVSVGNCFVLPSPVDSYMGIMYTDTQITQICCRRGGVGWDMSLLRPEGSTVQNAAKTTSGCTTFCKRYSNTIREVGQHGRRGASLQSLKCTHPSIEKFIVLKNGNEDFSGSNTSVQFTDEFMRAVEKGEDIDLQWPCNEEDAQQLGIPMGTVKLKRNAKKDIWDTFVESAWGWGDPGCCFIDTVHRDSPGVPFGHKEISCNPCGEQFLTKYSSCRLSCLNLLSYVIDPYTDHARFDMELFKKHARIIQRLGDDLVDLELECVSRIIAKIESDPEPQHIKQIGLDLWNNIKKTAQEDRRTGNGFTALGDALAALNLRYASKECVAFCEEMQRTYALAAYESSVDMAKELGAFPSWDPAKNEQSGFIKKIKEASPELFEKMQQYGRRNMVLLTVAPTGSVSLVTQTTSGVEPVFKVSYSRRKKITGDEVADFVDANGDAWKTYKIYHKGYERWMQITGKNTFEESPYYKSEAMDMAWEDRIEMQSVIQKWIDNSISYTINLPEDATKEIVDRVYMEAWRKGCKGITVYRDKCRQGVLLTDEAPKKEKGGNYIKRGKVLDCDVHHLVKNGKPYYVVVGKKNGEAYEVFTGNNIDVGDSSHIPHSVAHGTVEKIAKGEYMLTSENGKFKMLLTNGHSDESADALTRLISTGLRHRIPLEVLVHQIEKTEGGMQSFAKVLCRVLKKYIKDGQKVYGAVCPSCGSNNITRQEGCQTCKECGYSKCS